METDLFDISRKNVNRYTVTFTSALAREKTGNNVFRFDSLADSIRSDAGKIKIKPLEVTFEFQDTDDLIKPNIVIVWNSVSNALTTTSPIFPQSQPGPGSYSGATFAYIWDRTVPRDINFGLRRQIYKPLDIYQWAMADTSILSNPTLTVWDQIFQKINIATFPPNGSLLEMVASFSIEQFEPLPVYRQDTVMFGNTPSLPYSQAMIPLTMPKPQQDPVHNWHPTSATQPNIWGNPSSLFRY